MTQAGLWAAAGAAAAVTVISGVADHRRGKRRNLEKVGWMPWAMVQMLGVIATFVLAALAVLTR